MNQKANPVDIDTLRRMNPLLDATRDTARDGRRTRRQPVSIDTIRGSLGVVVTAPEAPAKTEAPAEPPKPAAKPPKKQG